MQENITYSISPFVPYEIFRRTNYTIICETLGVGNTFFLSEKTTKALFAKRLFVAFSTPNFLQGIRMQGFYTFDGIIDENYDSIQQPLDRYKQAFDQILWLSKQNPELIYQKAKPTLDHNRNRLFELQTETQEAMTNLVKSKVPEQYWG